MDKLNILATFAWASALARDSSALVDIVQVDAHHEHSHAIVIVRVLGNAIVRNEQGYGPIRVLGTSIMAFWGAYKPRILHTHGCKAREKRQ